MLRHELLELLRDIPACISAADLAERAAGDSDPGLSVNGLEGSAEAMMENGISGSAGKHNTGCPSEQDLFSTAAFGGEVP
jgi:hypothetical protein